MTQEKESPHSKIKLSRRKFLGTTVGTAAGASLITSSSAGAQEQTGSEERPVLTGPSIAQVSRDVGNARPPVDNRTAKHPGSDLMVQVLKDLGIEYVASNPGSSFEGLQESIVNYGEPPNTMPEFISAMHEESAVDMAQGYARAEGKPMVALLHGSIGLMHASMAIYQAFHSQTPVVLIAGRDDTFFIRQHSANDMGGIVRSITKWDAHPHTLEDSLQALQEAYRQAITPPCGPTLVILDTELQKEEAGDLKVPIYHPPQITGITDEQAAEIARKLVAADNPRISVGRLRTPEGVDAAVRLVEQVGASVQTSSMRNCMSFPQTHPACGPGNDTNYDYVLGLETSGADASIRGPHIRTVTERDTMGIGHGNIREEVVPIVGPFRPSKPGKNDITADAEVSLAGIIAEVEKQLSRSERADIKSRKSAYAKANQAAHTEQLKAALERKRLGWDGTPVSTARIYGELWVQLQDEDWCLSSPSTFSSSHHVQLWEHDKPYSYLGAHGAAGVGYCIGASAGAALAARDRDRIVIDIQCDGDLNYAPGSLWTAAHHNLPLLIIMHNNRAWHQELMFLQYMAGVRGRGTDRGHIGTTIRDPYIDYTSMATAYGIEAEGPIDKPELLAAAFSRGIKAVKQGRPYLIDVLTQPR